MVKKEDLEEAKQALTSLANCLYGFNYKLGTLSKLCGGAVGTEADLDTFAHGFSGFCADMEQQGYDALQDISILESYLHKSESGKGV